MPAAIIEPILFWQVHQPLRPGAPPQSGDDDPRPTREAEPWRSQSFSRTASDSRSRRKPTRYEKFTTRIVAVSSVLTLGITACLHVFNYDLETQTSSTSGTHSGFYKEGE
ncbi:hypothetical protein [Leucobacter chromiireducens]|uniref:Uncharacterized protein n=1 Tax=Leucobacter chromiireducens subsp. chromiireducens TaxID=660067 RepID=A0ABS1SPI0_9MICO|nr:hypothetical protein [Leucobacter chromiireducens]MBL3689889.1 hypothetical protein [Leucobacter chromiireducens subsp. chromiireducens]